MTHFNRTGAEFFTVGDAGVDFDSRRQFEAPPHADNGLYFRSHDFPELSNMVTACKAGELAFADLTLDAEQAWNETGWKEPHATVAAAARLSDKAVEECREVDDAVEEFFDSNESAHLVDELGDYKWVLTAIANNCGVVVSDGMKTRLYEYAVGTRVMNPDGSFDYADWYDTATQLAIKRGSLTFGEIDDLITAGFVPRFSPVMNLYDAEEICATAFVFDFQWYNAWLRTMMQTIYEHGGRFGQWAQAEPDIQKAGKVVAEVYLRTAAIAHMAGSSLSQVVERNITKIDDRIAQRTIDKTDPNRRQSPQDS